MKIFYLYTALTTRGGADRVITSKANYLSEHGYDIFIITDSQNNRPAAFQLSPKVHFIDLNINFGKEYGHNIFIRSFVFLKLMNLFKKRLKKIIIQEKPDIIISTLGRDFNFVSSLTDGSIKIAEAHTTKKFLRNFHLLERKNVVYKYLVKYLRIKQEKGARKLDALVLLTKNDEESWKGIANTYVINNATPFYPQESSTCENKKAIIVGRYNDAKGYNYLIDAWRLVNKKHPDWIINIYGSGEYKDSVYKEIHDKNLQDVMIMNDPTDDIMNKYLDSSIYVMSSRYEGFPMVLLEAMSCGVPCVAFDCPHGPRNIIENGEDGILVDYLNSSALAESVCFLIENDSIRKKMGKQAKINIKRFSEDAIMQQWIDLFNKLQSVKKRNYDF